MYGIHVMRYWRKQWAESRSARNSWCSYEGRKYFRSEMREAARKYAVARLGA